MNVSIERLKSHLSHYLRIASEGENVVVTSQDKPMAIIKPLSESIDSMPTIPQVRWANGKPRLSRSVAKPPKIEGEPLAAWIVRNRG